VAGREIIYKSSELFYFQKPSCWTCFSI